MTSFRLFLVTLFVIPICGCPELGSQERTITAEIPEEPTWADHVKPVLDLYCNECHSAPPQQLAPANFRLDVCESIGMVPGAKLFAGRIIFRTVDQLPSPMPPASYSEIPTAADRELLQRWVDQGAACDGVITPTNVTPNNVQPDMMLPPGADMGTPGMDMAVTPDEDMGMDVGADLGPPPATWNMVAAMLESKCSGCHDAGRGNLTIPMGATPAELQVLIEDQSAALVPAGLFITPNLPENSAIYLRVSSADGMIRMPRGSAAVDEALRAALESWILNGAIY